MTDSARTARALLLENVHSAANRYLTAAGLRLDRLDGALTEDELIRRVGDVEVLGIRSGTQVSRRVLEAAPRLRAVAAFCIGTEQIDLDAATCRGVSVFNAPFSNTRSVVEIAIAEIIALTRRLTVHNESLHAGVWEKSAAGSHEVRGRRLGIVGYGKIGSQLSVVAEALGMRVFYYDTVDKLALGNARRCSTLNELLSVSDVVSLHVDGRAGNSGLFGDDEFKRMRPGSLFLNLSRGFVVDHAALRRHIDSGHLAGAAVDVFPDEPRGRSVNFTSELRGLPNVILTPHVGGSTEEAQRDIADFVARKVSAYLRDGTTAMSVNFPEVRVPRRPVSTRLTLLHHNTPGVLATVNKVLARRGLNISQQVLATAGPVGYAVTDIGGDNLRDVVEELRSLPETVRADTLG